MALNDMKKQATQQQYLYENTTQIGVCDRDNRQRRGNKNAAFDATNSETNTGGKRNLPPPPGAPAQEPRRNEPRLPLNHLLNIAALYNTQSKEDMEKERNRTLHANQTY